MVYKQVIIVRKDLNMSHGKMSGQVSRASMAFLAIKIKTCISSLKLNNAEYCDKDKYKFTLDIDKETYDEWLEDASTRVVLQASNKNKLLKAKDMAQELGLVEGEDYFLIWDNCNTELNPEEDGRTLTCIGFRPMESEVIDKIGKKYHLYIG